MRLIVFLGFQWFFLVALCSAGAQGAAQTRVLVAFHSETGHTEAMAGAVAEGAASVEGVEVILRAVDQVGEEDILRTHGILVGTPVYWAGLSAQTKGFLDRVGVTLSGANRLVDEGRTAGAFCTGGSISSGKEMARLAILAAFLNMRFIVIGGVDATGHGTLGAQATFPSEKKAPSPEELEEARLSGERFARVTNQMHRAGVK